MTLDRPEPEAEEPLLPFEERSLQYLINQVQAASPRVKAAFMAKLAEHSL